MPLKDLVADIDKLDEESIEAIVSDYVRYDPNAFQIVFTPKGARLKNDSKLLVYLVAIAGWKYVVDDPVVVKTKPADLEAATGISGGTLRPTLKRLKDNHLVSIKDGHYGVQSANLDSVGKAISGEGIGSQSATKSKAKKSRKRDTADKTDQSDKKRKNASGELRGMLDNWIEGGFFNEPRTIKDLLDRYHENGIIVKQTSLSGLLLRAVRDGLLSRSKMDRKGKQIWTYRAK